jgi:predicted DCC family thiol-disulfide oxidoreductase YuxK
VSLSLSLHRLILGRTSSRPLAVARIGVSVAILLELGTTGAALVRLSDASLLHAPWFPGIPDVTGPVAWTLAAAWAAAGAAFLVGWHTRLAGSVLALALAGVLAADQQLYSNHLHLMLLATILLVVGDAGSALSLDVRRSGERKDVPAWPAFLLGVQVSIVYLFAGLAKLTPVFLSGSVMAATLRRDGPLAIPDAWRSFEPMAVLAVLAICAELFVALALLRRRWRSAAFVVGFGLHVTIAVWLSPASQLLIFGLLMLSLYVVFLDAPRGSRLLIWDDGCGFCAGWVRWFRRLDWLDLIRPVALSQLSGSRLPVGEAAAAEALHLVTPHGIHRGFRAVARTLELLPLSFAWAPMLRLPPVAAIGERVYRRVAARRACPIGDEPMPAVNGLPVTRP